MSKDKKETIEDNQKLDSWNISDQDFPSDGSIYNKLKFFLNYAILAPSGHNTQPWLFRIDGNTIELYADRTRALPVVDPEDRELTISCGAALYHLILAIRHFGYEYRLETPLALSIGHDKHLDDDKDDHDEDLLARVKVKNVTKTSQTDNEEEEVKLFQAIIKRRTNRSIFQDRNVPDPLLSKLEGIISEPLFSTLKDETRSSSSESLISTASVLWIHIAKDEQVKNAVADLIAEGDRIQLSDKKFRRELASWIHPNRSNSRDGIPGYAFGFNEIMSLVGPFIIRTFDTGKGQAAKDRQLATGSPILVVVGTKSDTPMEWLTTGLVLGKMLLLARSENVWTSFLNQPIEVPQLRHKLGEVIHREEALPQLLLRMGYANEVKPTPRRLIDEIIH